MDSLLSTLVSSFAAASTFLMILRNTIGHILPEWLSDKVNGFLVDVFSSCFSATFTFIIETNGWENMETFMAVQAYLPTRIGPHAETLSLVGSFNRDDSTPGWGIPVGAKMVDEFEGMQLTWKLSSRKDSEHGPRIKFFTLTCRRSNRDKVMEKYLPHVFRTAKGIMKKRDVLLIYSYNKEERAWVASDFNHPSTFDTLVMEPDLKKFIMEDLDLFVKRKEFFRSVGRAWKRGYLLYGPPGTGKSSLVGAIANYLRYHVYDLQLSCVQSDLQLRNILTLTSNRSILLVEDIDCSCKAVHKRGKNAGNEKGGDDDNSDSDGKRKKIQTSSAGVTLSGFLNFVDGLWSTCGDERIIIFTTNHKEKLDPALLRPGRMDVHVYLGYCTPKMFRMLARNYLRIEDHVLFQEIEESIQKAQVTPAEVAQQLMRNDPVIALESLVRCLSKKNVESHGTSTNRRRRRRRRRRRTTQKAYVNGSYEKESEGDKDKIEEKEVIK